jgi:hypothetical protein
MVAADKRGRATQREQQATLLGRGQWQAVLDRAARREFGISGDEFVRRLQAGAFGSPDDDPRVMRLVMLLLGGR